VGEKRDKIGYLWAKKEAGNRISFTPEWPNQSKPRCSARGKEKGEAGNGTGIVEYIEGKRMKETVKKQHRKCFIRGEGTQTARAKNYDINQVLILRSVLLYILSQVYYVNVYIRLSE